MTKLHAALVAVAAAPAALFFACSSGESHGTSSTGSGGSSAECPACVTDQDCASGAKCAQFGGDTYCAPDCTMGEACSADRACTPVTGAEGAQISVCVPRTDVCGKGAGSTTASSSASTTSGGGETCGSLVGPSVMSCCTSCKPGQSCQANGCYGGWWCNTDTCKCQAPPAPGSCGGTSTTSSSSSGGGVVDAGPPSNIGPMGGTLDTLSFAIVGDTRPAVIDDTAGYPSAVIQKIWQDVEAHSPRPAFAVTTGDYLFAKSYGSQAGPQIDKYLSARAAFTNIVFPAMGNHECTGATASNCGSGNPDGITNNYTAFLQKMLMPLGQSQPYYTIHINGTNDAWTAKFVFVAANAWNQAQATWLAAELAKPTTYTFVVRHEGTSATTAPGVTPSAQIMAQHPYTLLLAGHTHTFEYFASERQVITGNGGAPLTGSVNYGYVIAQQRADGAIEFTAYDYSTNAAQTKFAVKADGSKAP
jgi:hypothetical protein